MCDLNVVTVPLNPGVHTCKQAFLVCRIENVSSLESNAIKM